MFCAALVGWCWWQVEDPLNGQAESTRQSQDGQEGVKVQGPRSQIVQGPVQVQSSKGPG